MTRACLAASLLFVVACSQKKDEERVAPPRSEPVTPAPLTPAPGSAVPPPPVEAPPPVKLSCEKVFAKPLQDKYAATITDVPQTTEFSAGCKVKFAKARTEVELNVTCHDNVTAAKDTVLASVKDMQEMAGVGAPARKKDLGADGTQIMAWDDNSNCQVLGMLPKSVDAAAFTTDLLAALPAT